MQIRGTIARKLAERLYELEEEKARGKKVVGYFPSEYMPEELVLASGMIPVGLLKAGEYDPMLYSGTVVPRWQDAFCRAQVGYVVMKDPYYMLPDIYVNVWAHFGGRIVMDNYARCAPGMEMFGMEVPHRKDEYGLDLYLKKLHKLKDKLEQVSGNRVTAERLREAITLCNTERELLKEIALTRKAERVPIRGLEFMTLNHATYVLDKEFMVGFLKETAEGLKKRSPDEVLNRRPRVLLTGPTLGISDYQVYEVVEALGGEVVIEQFCEAERDYWVNVDLDGSLDQLMRNIAERYFMKKVCHLAFRPSGERRDFVMKLARDFKVDGVIWYQPMYQDNADYDFIPFAKKVKEELKLPVLKVYTEYDPSEKAALGTRIETFLKTASR
ncbi:MAG: 2-hydroxyacyl-CoA dehydratase family protein [Chloroflexota bacterium]